MAISRSAALIAGEMSQSKKKVSSKEFANVFTQERLKNAGAKSKKK